MADSISSSRIQCTQQSHRLNSIFHRRLCFRGDEAPIRKATVKRATKTIAGIAAGGIEVETVVETVGDPVTGDADVGVVVGALVAGISEKNQTAPA